MQRTFLALLALVASARVQVSFAAAGFAVQVTVGGAAARTDVQSLTSVTMDICLAKQNFPCTDPDLLALTSHLGGGASLLRIGGSDQNSFFYDVHSAKSAPFSKKTGGACCAHSGSCHGCAKDCTMPMSYWKTMTDFAAQSKHKLMFGLVPQPKEAAALISYTAAQRLPLHAVTFGNELDGPQITAGYPALRKLLDAQYPPGSAATKPLLAGPDVAMQRHVPIDTALAGHDDSVNEKLNWVSQFTKAAGTELDVVSWHTYDFESYDISMHDHQTLSAAAIAGKFSRFWSTKYLDFALRLSTNVTSRAAEHAPKAQVWLSESDSICHQGIYGATNAYVNSLWLVNRLGIMANANVSVMARQSLVGYNYSLLGNWPVEPIKPNPDYFTTVLFRRLFGNTVLATAADAAPWPPSAAPAAGGERARAFAFCAAEKSGGVAVAMVNFDAKSPADFAFDAALGRQREYLLSPGAAPVVAGAAWSSRHMLLNGKPLEMQGPAWKLPPALATGQGKAGAVAGQVTLSPLSVGFAIFPDAKAAACVA